jgi:small nuclear ribonucleoprotein (snRNP)-like protein
MSDLYKQITEWKNSGQFVSLVIVKKKVGRVTLYGKVISFDPPYNSILLYDEDSKSLSSSPRGLPLQVTQGTKGEVNRRLL